MSTVVADSIPVRGLVSVAAVLCQVLILRLAVVTGSTPVSPLQGKVINANIRKVLAPCRRTRRAPRPCSRRAAVGPATSPVAAIRRQRRDHADARRLRGAGTGLEQDHSGVRGHRRGQGRAVTTSYGASGDQSRAVVDGKPADIVNFSVEPDVTRLVKAGKVAKDWNADATKGIPFGSVVSLVVREGNPKNIKDWDDLLQPGLEVISPEPAEFRFGQVEPAGAVRGEEQRRQGPAGRPGLREQAGQRAHQDCVPGRAARPPTCSCRAPATC